VKRGVKEVVKALRKDTKGCVPGSAPTGGFPEIARPAAPTAARRCAIFLAFHAFGAVSAFAFVFFAHPSILFPPRP
jgi:hypothetical protein